MSNLSQTKTYLSFKLEFIKLIDAKTTWGKHQILEILDKAMLNTTIQEDRVVEPSKRG